MELSGLRLPPLFSPDDPDGTRAERGCQTVDAVLPIRDMLGPTLLRLDHGLDASAGGARIAELSAARPGGASCRVVPLIGDHVTIPTGDGDGRELA
jgi:hypothetical protein